jgi:hypothetical protein
MIAVRYDHLCWIGETLALVPLAVVPFLVIKSHWLQRTGILLLVLGVLAIGDAGGGRVGAEWTGTTSVRRVCLAPVPAWSVGTTSGTYGTGP